MRNFALGPSLGQCCGGYTQLLFELFTARERPLLEALARDRRRAMPRSCCVRWKAVPRSKPCQAARTRPSGRSPSREPCATCCRAPGRARRALIRGGKGANAWFVEPLARRTVPLIIYGAGHVGRALVRVLQDLPFAITWVDTAAVALSRSASPPHVRVQATADLPTLASAAPAGAWHIVMTYSHALDLAICHAVLRRGDFGHLGLIGSATKRARFMKRLTELGIAPARARAPELPDRPARSRRQGARHDRRRRRRPAGAAGDAQVARSAAGVPLASEDGGR